MARSLRVGRVPAASDGGGKFYGLKDGDTATMTVLVDIDEIVSVDQYALWDFNPAPVWVHCGDDDPGMDLGLKPGYRAFVPVEIEIEGTKEIRFWSIGIGLHRELSEIAEMAEGLKGLIIKAKRTGSGLKTRYSVLSTGKRAKSLPKDLPTVDDVIAELGPEDREGILELLKERTGMSFEKLVETVTGAKASEDEEFEEV